MAHGLAAAGGFVVCVDRDEQANRAVAAAIGSDRAVAIRGDVTDRGAVEAAVAHAMELTGSLDVLVNSAGIGGRGPAGTYPDDLWADVLSVNLTGSFSMCRAVGALMVERGRGSIVNVASIGGLVGFPGSVGYQASKGGVVQMTRTLAVEWAPYGVRVNAIAPGHIATAIVRRQWETEPELRDFFLSRTPLGRLGEPEDVVGPAIFLASDASAMMTGQILVVDGGYTAQ
jgi:NAD(P)-dependent dehydrogenase (short-subunit alcohol dehydrogenase family)